MRFRFSVFVLIVLIVAVAGGAAFWYFSNSQTTNASDPATLEISYILKRVSEIAVLPEDETPTVATVTDPEALAGQEFFKNTKIGDKVIIYSKARKAILYDPVNHKIVEMAPLNLETGNPN